jgi:hypothetical protein
MSYDSSAPSSLQSIDIPINILGANMIVLLPLSLVATPFLLLHFFVPGVFHGHRLIMNMFFDAQLTYSGC